MSTNESAETVSAETAAGRLREIARSIESRLDEASVDALVRGPLSTRNAREANEHRMPPGALIHMALLNDALCVAETAILEDRVITASEADYIAPLVREVIPYLGRLRGFYEGFGIAADEVKQLLETHSQDRQPFGGKCEETRWAGVDLCLRFAERSSDASPLRDYTDVMARMIDDIFDLSPGASVSARDTLRSLLARRAGLGESRAPDPREAAFCRASCAEVFHAVAHAQDVFSPDPLDVVEIHEEARDSFERIVTRVASSPSHGRMLLIKGESGSGKTHLMRAFRTHVHRERSGYVAYMQMSTQASNYARYVLSNVVDSLDRPFLPNKPSALSCIADAMLRGSAPPRLAERLRSEDISAEDHAMVVGNVADYVVATPGMETIDVDLVRAFAYLVSESPAIRARALRYLRCDDLTDYDRRLLGGMSPMLDEAAPMRMLTGIGKLAFAANRSALVFLLDQLEDLFHLDGAAARFRALVDALRQITDHVPTSVVVVACLDDYYEELRPALPRPLLDRLERDPEPVRLLSARTTVDVELLVSRRLRHLFESQDVTFREDEPLWPFPREKVHALATLRTRDVLDWCRSEHGRCIEAGRIVAAARPTTVRPPPPPPPRLATEWMEFQSKQAAPPTDDSELARLLHWSVVQAARELELRVDVEDGFPLALKFGGGSKPAVLGLCNRDARGSGLSGQVDEVRKRAEALAATVILARSSEFPAPGKTKIAEKLGEVVKRGGRKVLVSDGDWRQLQALKDFLAGRPATPDLEAWLRAERPAARIAALSTVFDGVNIPASAPASRPAPTDTAVAKVDPETGPQAPSPPAPPKPNGALAVGRTRSLVPADVTLETADLARHAAFLGSTGSGKTTLALAILEQCLARGIPALLVDRKGDLST
jgi:adenylylsulfate kinase-like enzyme